MEEWTIPAPAPPFLRDWILITVMTGKTESALQPHSIAGTFCLLSFGQAHAWPQPLSRPPCARWYVYCRHSSGAGLQGCQWTGYLNNFDAELSYITPSGAVMTGIASCKKGRPIPGAKRLRFALPWLASRLLRSSVLALVSFLRQRCFHEKWQTTITVSFVCVEQEGGSCFHRYDCTPRGVTHPRHPPPHLLSIVTFDSIGPEDRRFVTSKALPAPLSFPLFAHGLFTLHPLLVFFLPGGVCGIAMSIATAVAT